ncbi:MULTISPECIES: hypothetical protein [unclassified Streptomyces]|uniref:hypothetical protein n=1 Tax=unclassified Streptomyces TaxID=2593676 RepID=UPI002E0F2915|nr:MULTISPECIES: hypothetical protein [unclassified Streptomyces]WSR20367.1 hypothetical protein OG457_07525 [Streptomyces sp. NBC_01207]WTA23224.1 hypothetical protein OG365_02940 [Streptomyces sp. NBC_00853]
MAWLYAEYIADELLRTGRLIPASTLEFRAGRDTLALTIYLSDAAGELSGIRVVSQLDEWLSLTAYGHPWRDWVHTRFLALDEEAHERGDGGDPDLELARAAWRWLDSTELFATNLDPGRPDHDHDHTDIAPGLDENARVWTPAWQLGLPLGHLAMHLF